MTTYRLQDALYIPFNGVMEWAIQLNNGLYLHHSDLTTLSKMVWHKNKEDEVELFKQTNKQTNKQTTK